MKATQMGFPVSWAASRRLEIHVGKSVTRYSAPVIEASSTHFWTIWRPRKWPGKSTGEGRGQEEQRDYDGGSDGRQAGHACRADEGTGELG